tara:strand:- start:733 stop:1095 length:363 start_codon:yes stop_codon:yes gene_type:complete
MKSWLKTEELLMFGLGIFLFSELDLAWWWFPALLLLPDIGMLGYLFGNRAGAVSYNLFHHKGIALALYLLGTLLSVPLCQLCGVILFSHASFDRIFGYGLKYGKGFAYTHLGEIGRKNGH